MEFGKITHKEFNPSNVQERANCLLDHVERVMLTDPVEYEVMAHLMIAVYLILTDRSGVSDNGRQMRMAA